MLMIFFYLLHICTQNKLIHQLRSDPAEECMPHTDAQALNVQENCKAVQTAIHFTVRGMAVTDSAQFHARERH
jgi:hypothetical protein